ncbi:hypothetical protein GDO78_015692 [Eleutherodactylus coqui]|uniref:Uncharacterized protein n=1 Tax=Eleutherodactylus coqui TaxID=57060 RepID=A0A8J6BES5_ELECQ|nr:hypothetical protein GDO78_015692 [Eleutherodactylus coqui]
MHLAILRGRGGGGRIFNGYFLHRYKMLCFFVIKVAEKDKKKISTFFGLFNPFFSSPTKDALTFGYDDAHEGWHTAVSITECQDLLTTSARTQRASGFWAFQCLEDLHPAFCVMFVVGDVVPPSAPVLCSPLPRLMMFFFCFCLQTSRCWTPSSGDDGLVVETPKRVRRKPTDALGVNGAVALILTPPLSAAPLPQRSHSMDRMGPARWQPLTPAGPP